MKAKSFSTPRNINDIDAVRIDWKTAVKEAEDLVARMQTCTVFKDVLRSYELLLEIQRLYRTDNIEQYLTLLENNRDVLKGDAVSFAD